MVVAHIVLVGLDALYACHRRTARLRLLHQPLSLGAEHHVVEVGVRGEDLAKSGRRQAGEGGRPDELEDVTLVQIFVEERLRRVLKIFS